VHRLTAKHIAERKTNSRLLYENYLSCEKWKNVVTIDEGWIYLSNCNKKRAICYRPICRNDPVKWYLDCKESYPRGFMIVTGFCYEGKLSIRRIPKKTKINSIYYQDNVLKPLFEEEIPKLYGNRSNCVYLNHDKASSHTSRSTAIFLENICARTGINVIPFSHIPVKSPDASPMDFCVFGLLKRSIAKRKATTIEGLWKVVLEEWDLLDLGVLRKALLSWKVRCRAIAKAQGYPIEHNRKHCYGLY